MPNVRSLTSGGWRLLLALLVAVPIIGIAGVPGASVAAAQGVVRDIRVAGNRRVEPETVRTYMKLSVGDAYDAGKVDQSIRALFATGLFSDVRIDRDGAALVVTVVENPVINQVAFEGNKEVDKDTLEKEVQLKSRAVFTRARVQSDVQRILDVYRRQGRFAARVEPKIIETDNNRVNLVFEIDEGNATKVKSISFIGNRAFSDSNLRDIITTTQSGLFDFLKGTNIYDPDRLSLDRELLRQYYLKNGYADAQVVSANAELDRDGSGFFITFAIDEGELFNFGEIRIESTLAGVNTDALRGDLLTKPGELFDGSKIEKTVERLTLLTSEQGYAFARVRPRVDRDPGSKTMIVTYAIDEGPRVYIERINIVGNQRTLDYVIRREFRLAEGDAFNPLMIDRAKKRLQNLGFFKTVEVKRRPGSAPDRVTLDVEVVEQSTGELSFGAGYSTSEGVIGDVSLTERNLLGRGQFLRLRLAGSQERMNIDLSFTEPRFLDRNLAAGFDIFHKTTQVTSRQPFATEKTGASVRLGFPLAENLWFTSSYTLSRDKIFDVQSTASRVIKEACDWVPGTAADDPLTPQNETFDSGRCTRDAYWTSSLGGALTWDNRNHPKNPTRGTFFQLATDFAGLGGDVKYVRVQGEGRAYYPITEKITLVGRVMGGHIAGYGGEELRLLDLFYKGGETIRGFSNFGYGPRDLNTNQALGGTTYWATTAEVRFPFPGVPDDLGLSGAIFADAGSLFGASAFAKNPANAGCTPGDTSKVCLAADTSVRASIGASLIWNSPLGPLRLDVSKALLKKDYDDEQLIRFGASTKF
jgi:outer membrane protein insertion porin family